MADAARVGADLGRKSAPREIGLLSSNGRSRLPHGSSGPADCQSTTLQKSKDAFPCRSLRQSRRAPQGSRPRPLWLLARSSMPVSEPGSGEPMRHLVPWPALEAARRTRRPVALRRFACVAPASPIMLPCPINSGAVDLVTALPVRRPGHPTAVSVSMRELPRAMPHKPRLASDCIIPLS